MRSARRPTALALALGAGLLAVCTACAPGFGESARQSVGEPAATGPAPYRYVFPIGAAGASYGRTHAIYPATDIIAGCGQPVVAVTDGTVLEVSRVDLFQEQPHGLTKGGMYVSLNGEDGVRYYGSHLSVVAPGLVPGQRVRAGQVLGRVGRTGNSSNVCHLHFAISPVCAGTGDWWLRRGVIYPWPYLDAWRRGEPRSPGAEVTAWHRAHGCPAAPPPSATPAQPALWTDGQGAAAP